jgi:bifunctional UDP-N-acetylglucosamine pyrophosphorylase / glucosamine-1-phosphate N-acetyltransferase
MRSAVPKHLHPLLGRRMIDWVLAAVAPLEPASVVVVASPSTAESFEALGGVLVAVQAEPLGTGDAVASARDALAGFDGDVLVVPGDGPLLTTETLRALAATHRDAGTAATLLSFTPEHDLPYGRIIRDEAGRVSGIVEAGDATPEQLAIRELNGSVYVFAAADLWRALERLEPANAQGELYLTDTIGRLVSEGLDVAAEPVSDPDELQGVNTRAELAAAAAVLRQRINAAHLEAGVTVVDPPSTWIEPSVRIDADAVVHPFTVLRGRTRIAAGAEVGPHVVVDGASIGANALVGPFCYVRPGTVLGDGVKAGTFVEIKNSHVEAGAKVPHLSYIGDADIGERTNIGAGTITANLPPHEGRGKQRTRIGRDVKTSVHNSFVAPVTIGDDAWTAAGSVITEDVPPGSLAGFPPRQLTKEGYVYARRDDD